MEGVWSNGGTGMPKAEARGGGDSGSSRAHAPTRDQRASDASEKQTRSLPENCYRKSYVKASIHAAAL